MPDNAYKSTHTGAEIDRAVDTVQNATAGGGTILTTANGYTKDEVYDKTAIDQTVQGLNTSIGSKANSDAVYTKEETNTLLGAKQDQLTPGTGITIQRNPSDNKLYINGQQINLITIKETLPQDISSLDVNTLYFVPRSSGSTNYMYNKYVIVVKNNQRSWEQIDANDIDLSPYALKADVESALALKQNALTAGTNITIDENNVISASGDVSIDGTLTENHLIAAADGTGEIKDTGVDMDSIKTVKMGITNSAYIRFEDIPGLKVGDKLKVHVSGTNSNCHIKAVAYPGKNICNIAAVNHEIIVENLLGARDTYCTMQAGAYYYAPASTGSGFAYATSLSNASSAAKKITLQAEHKYLIMADFTCVERTDDQQKAFAPSLFGVYNNTTGISGTATPTADSANTATSKKFYAFVKPTWSVSRLDSGLYNSDKITTGLTIVQDGNSTASPDYTYTEDTVVVDATTYASEVTEHGMLFTYDEVSGLYKKSSAYAAGTTYYYRTAGSNMDKLNSLVIIDVTDAADDAYSQNTTTLIITEANVWAKYKAQYSTLSAGNTCSAGKSLGPWGNNRRQYIRAYYRKLYVKVPKNYRLFIREYKGVTSAGEPSGYLKTMCVNATSALSTTLVLDQAVTLNAPCLEYVFSTTSDTVVADPSELQVMVMYYEAGNENTDFVPYTLPINIKTHTSMPYNEAFDNTTCILYGSGSGESEYDVTVSSQADYITGSISIIAENSSYPATFAQNVTDTASDKTYVEFAVDSVNDAIVAIRNQIVKINQSPVLNTLPTAKGTYKYEVSTEGVPGTWTKEEETVTLNTAFGKNGVTTYADGDIEKIGALRNGQMVRVKIGVAGYTSYSWVYAMVISGGWLPGAYPGNGAEKQYAPPILIYGSKPAGGIAWILVLNNNSWRMKSLT